MSERVNFTGLLGLTPTASGLTFWVVLLLLLTIVFHF